MATRTWEDFVKRLRTGVGQTYTKKTMRMVAELAIEIIVARTRKGYGVNRTGGNADPLKKLSDTYIKYRSRNRGKLDSTTSPGKSNLTMTGKFLRSMHVKEVRNDRVQWGPNRVIRKGGITNEKIGEHLEKGGRPFNYLTKAEITALAKYIDKVLQGEMRRV